MESPDLQESILDDLEGLLFQRWSGLLGNFWSMLSLLQFMLHYYS